MSADSEAVKAHFIGARFVKLVDELGGSFKGTRQGGRDVRIPCFMHGGSGPNLVLTPARGLWHCLSSCGGGDVLALVMRARGVDFLEALTWLGGRAGIRLSCAPSVRTEGAGSHVDAAAIPCVEDARQGFAHGTVAMSTPTRPNDECGAFLAALWRCLAESCWSAPVARWLSEVRGVEPDAAYALGCRDWSTVRPGLADLLDESPVDALEAVGLARDGRLHPAVLGCLRGDPEWAAVAVPIWRFGHAYPERWRFRLVTPRATQHGGTLKSLGPYRTELPIDLLGAGRPDRLDAPEVRLAHLGSGVEGAGLVVLVEGEPDLWSATEVVDGRAVVLAVCGSPTRWREGWPSLHDLAAIGVRRVAVCVHKGDPSKGTEGRGHGERFAEVVAVGCARAGLAFTRKLAAEGEDLNDLHRAGRLRGFLADVLEVNHGR